MPRMVCLSGPDVTEASLGGEAAIGLGDDRRIAHGAQGADQLGAQHGVVGRLVRARRPAQAAHRGAELQCGEAGDHRLVRGSPSYMLLICAKMSAIRVKSFGLALAGAASARSNAAPAGW